jgi:Tol biopolymer transport system component
VTLETGTRLGPYEIVAPIGAGGMGEVYQARDTRLSRIVAIKILPAEFASDAHMRMRFDREARAISALNHPHICTLHDIGSERGVDFLVMEHCDGRTLARRLADGPLSTEQLIDYATQIADALDKAHRQGIVHRDLKPSNIMITKSGVKVLDFGLAKERGNLPPEEATVERLSDYGTLVGTVQYMAPEVLKGKGADARSDIFALGLVMYEMATGRPAFAAESKAGVIAAILEREPRPVTAVNPHASPSIARLIHACLEKDPDERLQSAHDVLLHLKWATQPDGTAQTRRLSLRAVAVALLAVAAVGAVAIAVLMRRQSGEEAEDIRHLAITLPTDAALSSAGTIGNPFAVSPDGKRVVYVGSQRSLLVRNLDRPTVQALPGTEGALAPFFSPDGKWVAFAIGTALKKVPLAGGDPVTICDGIQFRGGFWWSDDTIVVAQLHGPLIRVDASGGKPQVVARADRELRFPALLPGRKEAIVTVSDVSGDPDRYEVAILTLSDGSLRTLVRGAIHGRYSPTGHLVYVRSGNVYRAPFDARTKSLTGEAQPVLDDVASYGAQGVAYFELNDRKIYYLPRDPAMEHRNLVWVDRRGLVTNAAEERQGYYAPQAGPRLSPDQRWIAVAICGRGCDVWRYEIDRATWSRVTSDGKALQPVWSPNGRSIVYTSNRNGPYNLFTIPADGSGGPRQITTGKNWPFPSSWSPDGKLIAVSEQSLATERDVLFIAADGKSAVIPYLTTAANETEATFSPDGRWVAYESSTAGHSEVYVRSADGIGGTWQVSSGEGRSPRWRGDGRELFYRREQAMMAVDVRMTSRLAIGKPRLLFEGNFAAGFDVTPDGQRFLMVRLPRPTPRNHINVVEGLLP